MRVLVLYNEPVLAADHPDADSEHEILYTTDAVAGYLAEAGFEASRLGVSRDPAALLSGLRRTKPDVCLTPTSSIRVCRGVVITRNG